MNINLLDDALHALNRAAAQAALQGLEAVEPIHILAGVLSEGAAALEETLGRLGVSPADVSPELLDAPATYEGHLPYASPSHDVLTVAVDSATDWGHEGVTSLHLLHGLIQTRDGEVARALAVWDLDGDRLAEEIQRAAPQTASSDSPAD